MGRTRSVAESGGLSCIDTGRVISWNGIALRRYYVIVEAERPKEDRTGKSWAEDGEHSWLRNENFSQWHRRLRWSRCCLVAERWRNTTTFVYRCQIDCLMGNSDHVPPDKNAERSMYANKSAVNASWESRLRWPKTRMAVGGVCLQKRRYFRDPLWGLMQLEPTGLLTIQTISDMNAMREITNQSR